MGDFPLGRRRPPRTDAQLLQGPRPPNPQTPRSSDLQTPRPPNPQTSRPQDPQTPRSSDPQTYRPPDPQTLRSSEPETPKPPDPQTPKPPNPQILRSSDPETPKPPDPQTPKPQDPQTPRPSDLQTPLHQQGVTDPPASGRRSAAAARDTRQEYDRKDGSGPPWRGGRTDRVKWSTKAPTSSPTRSRLALSSPRCRHSRTSSRRAVCSATIWSPPAVTLSPVSCGETQTPPGERGTGEGRRRHVAVM
ncbi:Proteoglycan 4 [Liparis tanakae]|uniref:Proteoglycan 4 n=1 Tax=Liparis tanakae TaxID=230148 RepID=A0A4Z2FDN0_9TELE|nr:Proteoglycan 4 [Liparis tanakae]